MLTSRDWLSEPGGLLVAVLNPLHCTTDPGDRNPTAGITQMSYTNSHLETIFEEAGFTILERAAFELETRGLLQEKA